MKAALLSTLIPLGYLLGGLLTARVILSYFVKPDGTYDSIDDAPLMATIGRHLLATGPAGSLDLSHDQAAASALAGSCNQRRSGIVRRASARTRLRTLAARPRSQPNSPRKSPARGRGERAAVADAESIPG